MQAAGGCEAEVEGGGGGVEAEQRGAVPPHLQVHLFTEVHLGGARLENQPLLSPVRVRELNLGKQKPTRSTPTSNTRGRPRGRRRAGVGW
jgi:hypothetical protein